MLNCILLVVAGVPIACFQTSDTPGPMETNLASRTASSSEFPSPTLREEKANRRCSSFMEVSLIGASGEISLSTWPAAIA